MSSKSKSQQRLMGWAKSIKDKGKNSKEYKEAPQNIKDIVDSMTKKELDDFAGTKHKGLPEEVKKDKKNENSIITDFSNYKKINEHRFSKGYPVHLDNPPSIAGIEEEEFNTIIIVEDEKGVQYAIEEQLIDEFLDDNHNFTSTIVQPPVIEVLGKDNFDESSDTIKFIKGEWVFPKYKIIVK